MSHRFANQIAQSRLAAGAPMASTTTTTTTTMTTTGMNRCGSLA